MHFAKNLQLIMAKKGLTQTKLAKKINSDQTTLSRYLSGKVTPRPTAIQKIAKALEVPYEELIKTNGKQEVTFVHSIDNLVLPVVGNVGAADSLLEADYRDLEPEEIEYNKYSDIKLLKVDSNSMAPLAFKGQHIAIIDNDCSIRDGALVFVRTKDGEQLFKRYFKGKDGYIVLQSNNPLEHTPPIMLTEDDIEAMYQVAAIFF